MSGPIFSLKFVHNAIDAELRALNARAEAALHSEDIAELADDLHFFRDLMRYHHLGEEVAVFPLLDQSAPGYAATYLFDHKAEQGHLESLCALAASARDGSALDLAIFRRELQMVMDQGAAHINKENTLVLPELAARFSPPEQGEIVGKVIGAIPKEKMPALVPWIVARQSDEDAEAYVRGLMAAMPAPVFSAAKSWIQGGVDETRWSELCRRVPELSQ